MKKVRSTALALLTIFSCLVLFTSCEKTDIDINNYESKRQKIGNACDMMPSLTDLGKYSDIRYSHKFTENLLFATDTLSLFVQYSPSEYKTKKQEISASYSFLKSPIVDDDGDYLIPVSEIDYKGYHFKIVSDKSAYRPCQSFLMVGFDDANSKIAYCYLYDVDLDYIGESTDDPVKRMDDFISQYFLWNDFN